jgi:hypothetical protein
MTRLITLLLLPIAAGALHATVAAKLDLATLADKSELVVVAKIEGKYAKWDAANTGIWTHHTLTVSETLKGEHKAAREFVSRGGVVGNRGQHVAGSGNFEKGDEYVLFLWKDDAGRYRLTGMVQGAFKITEVNGVRRATNTFTRLTIVDASTLQPAADKSPLDYTLAELKKQVAARLKEAEKKE